MGSDSLVPEPLGMRGQAIYWGEHQVQSWGSLQEDGGVARESCTPVSGSASLVSPRLGISPLRSVRLTKLGCLLCSWLCPHLEPDMLCPGEAALTFQWNQVE